MASTQNTRLSTLVVSATAVLASVVGSYQLYINGNEYVSGVQSAATQSGAILTAGGGIGTYTSLNGASCQVVSGRYVDCQQTTPLISNTGGCVAGGCSVRSYNVGALTKPYTGSGVVKEVLVGCGPSAVSTKMSVGFVSATTASGKDFFSQRTIGSGALQTSLSGSFLWTKINNIIKVSTSANVGTTSCYLTVDSAQQ